MGLITKLFGTRSQREVNRIMPIVRQINELEPTYKAMDNATLQNTTVVLKQRLANGETLDDILPDAFAATREAARRVLGQRHFDVQLIGGIILHQGRIAEMKTGEGKTLTSTLPAYLNALTGKGVHIVTVNDYLARRDSEWMGKLYSFMGLSVGLIVHDMDNDERRAAYAADITYATNNELGFDYLRDNMAVYKRDTVGRGYAFGIIDEVDSILIDEARTPLIISGIGDESTDLYKRADRFAASLKMRKFKELDSKEENDQIEDADYVVDEKARSVTLTASGIAKAEREFGVENLSDAQNTTLMHHINQAIRARGIMRRDIDYVVKDGEIVIVDEFTGRLMFGRRYSEGLHQAIEAKENVTVNRESKTLATITFQNFFRLYSKISGMTGTALTEQEEFESIYNLDVIEIPTNRPMIRIDRQDEVYKTEKGKFLAAVRKIKECHAKGQPVLVGTISIEKSEYLSSLLAKEGISHSVLNAKKHDKEAEIVAQAGRLGAVTIATNMAGRGTDISLGGNPAYMAMAELRKKDYSEELLVQAESFAPSEDEEVIKIRAEYKALFDKYKAICDEENKKVAAAGGLFILGTERHESRRIDNQLRGRAGRQGDPGETIFFLSLEDDLMRLFGSERIMGVMEKLGIEEDVPITHKMLTGVIENAQRKVESRNFQVRKHVLEYDDVINQQREIIYAQRKKVLDGEDISASISSMRRDVIRNIVFAVTGESTIVTEKQILEVILRLNWLFSNGNTFRLSNEDSENLTPEKFTTLLCETADEIYAKKEQEWGPLSREIERIVLLRNVDKHWMDHIDSMEELRRGIGLRAYAQDNPVVEYKREGRKMFDDMIGIIRENTTTELFRIRVRENNEPQRKMVAQPSIASHGDDEPQKKSPVKAGNKPGRNDPCPCGSGKKYKKCCGANK